MIKSGVKGGFANKTLNMDFKAATNKMATECCQSERNGI